MTYDRVMNNSKVNFSFTHQYPKSLFNETWKETKFHWILLLFFI